MFQIFASVQVTNKKHPRFGQAGKVSEIDQEDSGMVGVTFDIDSQSEAVAAADLKAL